MIKFLQFGTFYSPGIGGIEQVTFRFSWDESAKKLITVFEKIN